MKRFLKIFIPLIILGAIVYQFRVPFGAEFFTIWDNLAGRIETQFFTPAPCAKPIPYKLGTFDPQFNISESYFLSALAEAETIWEEPVGLDLFTYASSSTDKHVLKINLIYDSRQQTTDNLVSLGSTVTDNQATYNSLKAKYSALAEQIAVAKNEYNLSPSKAAGLKINEMVSEINTLVTTLNRLVDTLNISVKKYNTVNATLGESFEEGNYVEDGSSREIDIYEFSNREKLVRVLAHELGHALGLDHVDDPKAIMYKLNEGDNATLTSADLAELRLKCGIK